MGERKDGVMRCCWLFVYLRLLQIEGKNRRNSLLKEKREDFYGELGDHKQETRECQRVNEFVANTSL